MEGQKDGGGMGWMEGEKEVGREGRKERTQKDRRKDTAKTGRSDELHWMKISSYLASCSTVVYMNTHSY